MLPPLPPPLEAELTSGISKTSTPAFLNLYRHLTTEILDVDVSTRATNEIHQNTHVSETLRDHHVKLAREAVLIRALRETCLDPNIKDDLLSKQARELGYLVSAYLTTCHADLEVDADAEELLIDEFDVFRISLPKLGDALSSNLAATENTMASLLSPLTPQTSTQQTRIPSSLTNSKSTTRNYNAPATLSSTLLTTLLSTQTKTLNTTLPETLTRLSKLLHDLLTTQTELLTSQIRHAELYTHSTASRHLSSHATFLGTVAVGLELKSKIWALQREKEVYAQMGVREGLRARWEELGEVERGLEGRERELEGAVEEYGFGFGGGKGEGNGNGMWEVIGRTYVDVEEEIERVRGDIRRLEGEVQKGEGLQRRGGGRSGRR